MTFKIGDTVQLKGGSPIMTVTGLVKGMVGCTWFDNTGNEKTSAYPEESLTLYVEEKESVARNESNDFMTS